MLSPHFMSERQGELIPTLRDRHVNLLKSFFQCRLPMGISDEVLSFLSNILNAKVTHLFWLGCTFSHLSLE
jgi:hypothetical protein